VPLGAALAELEETQWWDRDRLAALADRKLRELVRHCYDRMPAYQRLLREHGLCPDDVRTMHDLPRLPLMTKDFLRAAFPAGILDPALPSKDRYVQASRSSRCGATWWSRPGRRAKRAP
jgi:phenylacetate-CoA ligase